MQIDTLIRTPYHQLPITIVNKAMRQKVYRTLFCVECKWPLAQITDKIVIVSDGGMEIQQLMPDNIGLVEMHCQNGHCKQYYRMEFAL